MIKLKVDFLQKDFKWFLIIFGGWLGIILLSGILILLGYEELGVRFSEFGSIFYILTGLVYAKFISKDRLKSSGIFKGILTIFLSWIVFIIVFIIFFFIGFKLL